MCRLCGEGWRFEATELGGPNAGQVKAVLHPVSAEWENTYSAAGTGSLVLATRDPAAEDIWPGATGLYISQVLPDGSRRCRFGGYVEKFSGAGGGATTVALKSIDAFLDHRLIVGPDDPYTFTIDFQQIPTPPEQILQFNLYKPLSPTTVDLVSETKSVGGTSALGAFLVRVAQGNMEGGPVTGLPTLTATFSAPYTPYSFTAPNSETFCNWWDFKNIGQAIRELVAKENGPKYRLDHTYTDGYWSSVMTFSDVIGTTRDYTIMSDREGWQYGLEVDAQNKSTRTYGVGAGDGGYTKYSIAYDADSTDNLPEHQATVAWKDQTGFEQLDAQTRGHVTDHRDPVTVPSASIVGLPIYDTDDPQYDPQRGFPGPEILEPGDTFGVQIGYGVITIRDLQAKALSVAWSLEEGSTAVRTVAMQPIIRANDSVRTQNPARPPAPDVQVHVDPDFVSPPTVTPWPTPGLVSHVQREDLVEISGMQTSERNPGYVWVVEDEKETPDQVSCLKTVTGERVGFFNVTGVSPAPYGDPEAIRLSALTNELVIADIGDNDNNRPTSGPNQPSLLVVSEPTAGGNKGTLTTTRYPIAYPGGLQINAETLLIHPTTEEVFIVTKELNPTRVYSFGTLSDMSTVNNVGTLVATIGISLVADGTHTFNGNFVLFRCKGVAPTIVYKTSTWGKVGTIDTPPMAKSEAITVESSCAFLTTTEGVHAPIYRVLIPKTFGALCNTPAGPVDTGTGGMNGPAVVPGQVLDLQHWKLQLPI